VAAIDPADGGAAADRHDMAAADEPRSAVERALIAAGVDAATAVDIKRRRDEVTMAEMYLRDQATREGWLDTPRFRDEMDAVERQRTSIRDEVGDDGYDRYLAALGEPNRVRVDEVFTESPAASAGLQPGDVVLRYGEDRIFAPDDLVAATRRGTAGEPVRVQVLRHGERIELDVPRGPLGLRIAASQADPGEG
jgi:C-terminal processing protease CtpA/Prc